MRLRSSTCTPTSSRPSPSVFPARPAAKSTLSGMMCSPLASVMRTPSPSRFTAGFGASSDHGNAAERAVDLQDGRRVVDVAAIEGDIRRAERPRPGGDQDDVALEHPLLTGIDSHM